MPTVVSSVATGYAVPDSTTSPPFNVTAGQKVLLFAVWQDNATVPTVTGSPTLLQTGIVGTTTSGGSWYGAWVVDIGADNAAYTVTASKTNGYCSVFCVVVSGPFTSTESTELEDTSTPWSHSITTTAAGALLVGFFAPENQSDMTAIDTTPTGFTEAAELLSFAFWGGAVAHRQAATIGTYTWTPAATGGDPILRSGLVLIAMYGPTAEWRNSTIKYREAGAFNPKLIRARVAGAWVNGLLKGYK
jgi:hypothetical protein